MLLRIRSRIQLFECCSIILGRKLFEKVCRLVAPLLSVFFNVTMTNFKLKPQISGVRCLNYGKNALEIEM